MYGKSKVNHLGLQNSLVNQYVAELRDANIQKDSLRFRRNLERLGEIAAYEISKLMDYAPQDVTTPLGVAPMQLQQEQPVLVTILRAGLPMHQGVHNYFDHAQCGFVSVYRRTHGAAQDVEVVTEYLATPSLEGCTLILSDPMLATGKSMVATYKVLKQQGHPKHVHVVAAIASTYGVEYAQEHLPEDTTFWIAAIDNELSPKSYIVPGLGDAGDLAYGDKLDVK